MSEVNFTAPINTLGMGYVGLNLLKAFEELGHEPALWPIGPVQVAQADVPLVQKAVARGDSFNPNAPSLRWFHPWDLAHHVGRGKRGGMTVFELDTLTPREVRCLQSLDVAFVLTGWARDVLAKHWIGYDNATVRVIPHAVDTSVFTFDLTRWPKDEGPTTFINIGKWEVRKGHDILAQAFADAFPRGDENVRLVMACSNPFLTPQENKGWEDYYRQRVGDRVRIIDRRFDTQHDLAALIARADCGVFPARAEGWNLDLSECLAMGLPCIATNNTGHSHYVREAGCRLIETELTEPAHDGRWFNGRGRWARLHGQPYDQLVEHLLAVHKERQEARLKPNLDGVRVFTETFTWKQSASDILYALERDQ